jgi:hypothetical protein
MKKLQMIIQITYILTFFITSILMVSCIEGNQFPPMKLLVAYIISTILSMGKVIYFELKINK